MTLDTYLKAFRRYWLALVAGLLAGALLGFAVAMLQPKVYSADSSGFITTASSEGGSSVGMAVAGDSYAKSRAKSYADLGKKRTVAEAVIKDLGLTQSPESLVNQISVTAPVDTVTIKVSAKASSPQAASDLANAWIRAMATQIAALESGTQVSSDEAPQTGEQSTSNTPAATLTPLESAAVPSAPSSPNVKLYIAVGALLGVVLGAGFALLRSQYDRRIRSTTDVTKNVETPIVGGLPFEDALTHSDSSLSPDQSGKRQDSRRRSATRHLNEALRELRTNIEFIDVDTPPRAIVVTSALPGDGKSTVASNLAVVMAETGRTVVLIDGDLRKPTVAKTFGLPGDVGLSDLLASRVTLDGVLHRYSDELSLFILPAGSIPPNPSELLSSDAFHELVESFTAEGATVIIDAPPLLPVTDAAVLTVRNDGALVVASAGRTRIDTLKEALARIESVKGRTLGIVLNRIPTKGMDKYGYGYYSKEYYYGSDSKDSNSGQADHGNQHLATAEADSGRGVKAASRHENGSVSRRTELKETMSSRSEEYSADDSFAADEGVNEYVTDESASATRSPLLADDTFADHRGSAGPRN